MIIGLLVRTQKCVLPHPNFLTKLTSPMPTPKHILVVDDDKDDSDLYAEVLQMIRSSIIVKCMNDVRKALTWLVEESVIPALVISDINMPYMNGFQFRKAVMSHNRFKEIHIPFVLLTQSSSPMNELIGKQLSVVGIYEKPSSLKQMAELLNGILLKVGI